MSNSHRSMRIGVFYDGNFFLHTSNYYNFIHPIKSRIDIKGLHDFIRYKAAQLEGLPLSRYIISEAHFYRGRFSAAEAHKHNNQLYNDRVLDEIMCGEGVSTHYLPVRNYTGRNEERGIDVLLSIEVIEKAVRGQFEMVAFIFSDIDYLSVIQRLESLGIRTMLLGWNYEYTSPEGLKVITRTSHELMQRVSYPMRMEKIIQKGLDEEIIKRMFVDFKEEEI